MTSRLQETSFNVPKMDCPSEERMIRLALEGFEGVEALSCDFGRRRLSVLHHGDPAPIASKLRTLGLGAELIETTEATRASAAISDPAAEARTLKTLLAINAVMFVVEMSAALFARSTGLFSDSLDMFADAAVYGLALFVVGRSAGAKLRTAHLAGWVQAALGIGALAEVARRFVQVSEPLSMLMMTVAALALVANVYCFWLVSKHRGGGAHMQASIIFSANDVLANASVIVAGALVSWTGSNYPDLVVGGGIALVVLLGAWRILRLGRV
ncbi:MAG: cation transporter [Myxococcota bacterium]